MKSANAFSVTLIAAQKSACTKIGTGEREIRIRKISFSFSIEATDLSCKGAGEWPTASQYIL